MSPFACNEYALAGLLLLASQLPALGQTGTTSSTPSGVTVTTGIVGVTAAQTARLNVLNLQPVIPGVTAVVCHATLEFYDENGAQLKQQAVTNIPPATAASLVFKPAVSSTTGRAQIRAVVFTPANTAFNPAPGPVLPPIIPVSFGCNVMASLEIIDDATGATHTFVTDMRTVSSSGILPMLGMR